MAKRSALSGKRNYRALHESEQEVLRTLNNLYLEVTMVVSALRQVSDSIKWPDKIPVRVPSTGKESSTIQRTKAEVREIIEREISQRAFEKSIVLVVSTVEDYLLSCARLLLIAYPKRINKSPQGNDGKLSVDFNELIDKGIGGIIEAHASDRLQSVSYASPSNLEKYFSSILGEPVRQDAFKNYIEAKASRDLIVHAKGVINEIYLQKAGAHARGRPGEKLPVNQAYYKDIVRTAKQVCVSAYKIMMKRYGDDEAVERILSERGSYSDNSTS